jgi:hypothetical protein
MKSVAELNFQKGVSLHDAGDFSVRWLLMARRYRMTSRWQALAEPRRCLTLTGL